MSVKKVALLINNLNAGGCERTAAFLLNKLDTSVEWHLIMFSNEVHYPIPDNTNTLILNIVEKGWRRLLLPFIIGVKVGTLREYLTSRNIELLFVFNHLPAAIGGRLKASGWKGRFMINEQIHCTAYINGIKNPFKRSIKRIEITRYYPLADKIIVNAQGIANDLQENFGIHSQNLAIINNPLDLDSIQKLRNEPIDFQRNPDDFVFVHVGRYEPQKNHRLLIEAFSRLGFPKAKLWLIGNGSGYPEIEELIESRGLKEKIIQWGVQHNPFKFLHHANAFVLSSDYEGFPNVLLEAMACNLPILSTHCKSGPAELLQPDSYLDPNSLSGMLICPHGILIPVGDPEAFCTAMKKIYSDKALREKMSLKNLERLHEFKASEVLRKFESIILNQDSK
jgi:N-acetylgalactosamine-N,N'-diacetylbacillosaminyl-diphospho-undecaprenol 4-alpha-N-acetylgalactosaminyltransferase